MHCRDRLGMRAALVWRGTGGDVPDPGDPSGDDRHVRGGDHRVAAARHIAADTADRDVLMAEHDPGQSLDLDIFQRGALDLREIADLRLREFDIADGLWRHLGDEPDDLVLREFEARRRPLIKALAELAYCRIAAFGDIGDDRLNRAPDFGVGFFLSAGERPILGRAAHHA